MKLERHRRQPYGFDTIPPSPQEPVAVFRPFPLPGHLLRCARACHPVLTLERVPSGVPGFTSVEPLSPRLIVRPRSGWQPLDLRELWSYRELFIVLALRDIRVRYKQTLLGVAWAVIQPLFTMIIFTMIARFASIPTDGAPPPIFYYCGILPWFLFANSLTSAGNSLAASQHLIAKVYFPRLIVPIASVITALIDFGIAFLLLLGMMAWFRVAPGPQIVLLPLVVVLASGAALAFGFWLSALNVQFRDVRHLMPFIVQFWLFCTPVLYPSSVVHAPWKRALIGLNPLSGVVDAFRWCVLGAPRPGPTLVVSTIVIVAVFTSSLFYFRRVERTLVDRL
jgi:lipopolysaccharide transport system permease protein